MDKGKKGAAAKVNAPTSPAKSKDVGKKVVKEQPKEVAKKLVKKKEPVKKVEKKPVKEVPHTKEIPKATIKKMVLRNVTKDEKMRISKEIYGEINSVVDALMAKHWMSIQKEVDSAEKRTIKESVLTCFPAFTDKYKLQGADLKGHPFIIAKAVFQNKTRALGGEEKKYLFSKDFFLYYQAFVEAEIADLLREVIAATSHAKRVTIKTQDVEMVQKILSH